MVSMRISVFVSIIGVALGQSCQDGWTSHGRSCYIASRDTATWVEAMKMCEYHGGYLAHVESATEQSFMRHLVHNLRDKKYWLGGTDWARETKWIWEPYGKEFQYNHWLTGEPDNHNNAEHCLCLDGHHSYNWVDEDCHTTMHYICEQNIQIGTTPETDLIG